VSSKSSRNKALSKHDRLHSALVSVNVRLRMYVPRKSLSHHWLSVDFNYVWNCVWKCGVWNL